MGDGLIEILDFERGHAAVRVGLEHPRRATDGQGIRAELILHPLPLQNVGRLQAEHAFVKLTGTLDVRDRVAAKGQFGDFEHKTII